MHHVRRWSADAGLLVFLLGVEGTPLRTGIDLVFLDDQATLATDRLAAFLVRRKFAATLRALLVLVVLDFLDAFGTLTFIFRCLARSFSGVQGCRRFTHDGGTWAPDGENINTVELPLLTYCKCLKYLNLRPTLMLSRLLFHELNSLAWYRQRGDVLIRR